LADVKPAPLRLPDAAAGGEIPHFLKCLRAPAIAAPTRRQSHIFRGYFMSISHRNRDNYQTKREYSAVIIGISKSVVSFLSHHI
jgi:hypothetical protein